MYKTLILKFPWLYELIQSYRDVYLHRECLINKSFAQHEEDVEIMRLLKLANATGPYFDAGCNHPFKLSNTYLLYLNGWRGFCVDPLPRFKKLYKKWRPEDVFECIGIGEKIGELSLFEFEADVLSTLDQSLADEYIRQGYKFRRQIQTKIKSIDSVLESSGVAGPISLLSVDIEGHELSALKSITLDKWRPVFICLEVITANGKRNEDAIHYLVDNGYNVESDLGLNLLFHRRMGL
jgi:FkbM family methyltransferase